MMKSPPSVVMDIARKCDEDVAGAIARNMALVSGASQMSQVAFMGAASALGAAGGAFLAVHNGLGGADTSDDEIAQALWSLLSPMVVRSVGRLRARQGMVQ